MATFILATYYQATYYQATYSLNHLFIEKKSRKINFMWHLAENGLFAIFSKSKHFKAYVPSQLQHKCGRCGNVGVKKSLYTAQ